MHSDAEEVKQLHQDLLIGITSFFREPQVFEILQQQVIVPMVESKPRDVPVRIWVPGCATGEEAYSIAILLTLRAMESEARAKGGLGCPVSHPERHDTLGFS